MSLRKSSRIAKQLASKDDKPKIQIVKKTIKKQETKVVSDHVRTRKTKLEKIKLEASLNKPSEVFDIVREMHMDNAIDHFKKHDPKLAAYLNQTTVDLFKTKLTKSEGTNPFQSLARSIFYQQIHGKAATAIYNRFLQLFGEHESGWFPTPEQFLEKEDDELRSVGLSTRKIEYLRDLASKFKEKQITPEKFDTMSSEEISQQLCAVKGIGQWTVDMFLIFHLRHPDILPLGDLAVRKGVANHFGLALPSDRKKIFPPPQHMTELTELWRPYRTLGSWLMWHISDTQVTGDE